MPSLAVPALWLPAPAPWLEEVVVGMEAAVEAAAARAAAAAQVVLLLLLLLAPALALAPSCGG